MLSEESISKTVVFTKLIKLKLRISMIDFAQLLGRQQLNAATKWIIRLKGC